MPGPSEFMTGNAPQGASYSAPLVGFQLGQQLANLPEQYMKGRENAQKIAIDNMFPNGLPKNPDGSPNIHAAINTYMEQGAKIGGGKFVAQFLPFMLEQDTAMRAA